jgi:hypothetical protein
MIFRKNEKIHLQQLPIFWHLEKKTLLHVKMCGLQFARISPAAIQSPYSLANLKVEWREKNKE